MITSDLAAALVPVLEALTRLGVRHCVAGSIASSAHGIPRASIDADVVAELLPAHARPLVEDLRSAYYVPEQRAIDAIGERGSFNVIHLETMIKIDVFVARNAADRQSLDRAQRVSLSSGEQVPVCSPEDTILAKLDWFRRGGEVSERQWSDVVGLLRVGRAIDRSYLVGQAETRGLGDLLTRALAEAGAS